MENAPTVETRVGGVDLDVGQRGRQPVGVAHVLDQTRPQRTDRLQFRRCAQQHLDTINTATVTLSQTR